MAIARGPGTEIIRCHHFEDMDNTTDMIVGEQHHIYTVLSILVCTRNLDAATDVAHCWLESYDAHGGDTAQNIHIFQHLIPQDETFVWNDKFSFNGHEPTDFAGGDMDVTKQNAIADQGNASVSQKLVFSMTSADGGGQDYDVHVTFIDQNNE